MKLVYLILSALLFTANAQETSTGAPTTGPPATTATDAAVTTAPPPTTGPPTTGPPTTGPPTTGPPTAAPNTASTAPPPPPGPTPYITSDNLTTHHYDINGTDNNYCIMITLAMQFNLSYRMEDNNLNYAIFDLEDALATGDCNSSKYEQKAYLDWGKNKEFHLEFYFKKYDDDKDYGLNTMTFKYSLKNAEMFPNANLTVDTRYLRTDRLDPDSGSDYRIDMGGSYLCNDKFNVHFWYESINNVNYTTSDPTLLVTHMDNFKYQAFADKGVTTFGTYTECSSDFGTSDIVPIAVGCALAALVVIVLIAYLIGRRRSRQKGYQSV